MIAWVQWRGGQSRANNLRAGCNKMLWEKDIGADVKEWTMEHWSEWVRDKPDWFTAKVISQVPDSYIPSQYLEALGSRRKRRGSAVNSVRASLRESMREAPEDEGEVGGDAEGERGV